MQSSFRLKACMTCAVSKRKCDKQLPECQRCLDRDADCVYPPLKKRRRDHLQVYDSSQLEQQQQQFPVVQNFIDPNFSASIGFDPWNGIGVTNVPDFALTDAMIPNSYCCIDLTASAGPSALNGGSSESSDATTNTSPPWFLEDETWVVKRVLKEADCVVDIEFELQSFVRAIDEMLQSWVKKGHNSFIHRRLYDKDMPPCVQDAFTTLASYISRSPAVEDVILQIAEERCNVLICQTSPANRDAQGIAAHLARVQALFVYLFIRLFDGSIRLRASAEKQLPIMRQWVIEMWQTAKDYRGEESCPQMTAETDFDKEYDALLESWRLWILTESVRRTHVVIESIINVYEAMTKGWAQCEGAAAVTARRGLWEAESAMEWLELSTSKSPLLVPSLQPGPVISQYEADEFDEFVKIVWAVILGSEKIQYWNERRSKKCRT